MAADPGITSGRAIDGTTESIRAGGTVRVGSEEVYNYRCPMHYFRTLYTGSPDTVPDVTSPAVAKRAAGHVNMAPVGLGYLLQGNYCADVRTFFCPTAGDNMPADSSKDLTNVAINAAANPAAVKQCGGSDAAAISRGDWTNLSPFSFTVNTLGKSLQYLVVQGHYNYRCVPSMFFIYTSVTMSDIAAAGNKLRIRNIKPGHSIAAGEPTFKTSKQCAGRALVTDTFSQADAWGWMGGTQQLCGPFPGKGAYGHRDGYNALYGDWSAKWYGDPQQRIIWWFQTGSALPGAWGRDDYFLVSLQINSIGDFTKPDGTGGLTSLSSSAVWHQFDAAGGRDIDAP